jgi:hypothetical protein
MQLDREVPKKLHYVWFEIRGMNRDRNSPILASNHASGQCNQGCYSAKSNNPGPVRNVPPTALRRQPEPHSGSANKLLGLVNLSIGNNRNVCTVMTAEVALSSWLVAKVIAQGDRFAALWYLKIVVISGCYPLLTSPFCLKILSL